MKNLNALPCNILSVLEDRQVGEGRGGGGGGGGEGEEGMREKASKWSPQALCNVQWC